MGRRAKTLGGGKKKAMRTYEGFDRERKRFYDSSAWKKLRSQKINASPLCERCAVVGKVVPASEIDHIRCTRDYWELRCDWDNLQSLCSTCHCIKTRSENSGVRMGATVYVICGPICSGKSTWAREHSLPTDIVFDGDDVLSVMGVMDDRAALIRGLRETFCKWIRSAHGAKRAFIIITDYEEAKNTAAFLNARLKVMETSEAVCVARLKQRVMSLSASQRHERLIKEWFCQFGHVLSKTNAVPSGH